MTARDNNGSKIHISQRWAEYGSEDERERRITALFDESDILNATPLEDEGSQNEDVYENLGDGRVNAIKNEL